MNWKGFGTTVAAVVAGLIIFEVAKPALETIKGKIASATDAAK